MAVYLGVMGKQDGVDRVVQAAHHIVHTFGRKDVLFVLIGKGECWNWLQKISEELQVSEAYSFWDFVSDDLLSTICQRQMSVWPPIRLIE